jgi:ABC transport system ATP-binding/permease protein
VIVASLEGVGKRYADRRVFDGVTIGVDDRDRVGVIGRNGSGKSTLLRLVAGVVEPDEGRVVHRDGARLRYLSQDPDLDPQCTPLDVVLAGPRAFDPLVDRADVQREQQARATLDRLGVGDVEAPIGNRSGGERKRIALAAALAEPSELLVLDEPTNHLDVDVIEWLEGRLRALSTALVLVTHDRYLLDAVATRVVELEAGTLYAYHGSYASYLEDRQARQERADASERKRANLARIELAWLRRSPAARTSKAKARVDRARELVESTPRAPEVEMTIGLAARRLGGKVVHLHNAGVRFGDRWVLRGLDWKLGPGQRLAVVGPNGSGKTTLLRLLAGHLAPSQGSVRIGDTVHVGCFGQQPDRLPPRTRVLDAVTEVVREAELAGGARVTAGQLLERFAFTQEQQKAYVEELSGGESRRLELLRVLGAAPNLLLLDEPTNDLDLDTLAVLEAELDAWDGTVVVASHDRYFIDRVCEHIYAIEPGGMLRHHPGGWTAYRAAQRRMDGDRAPAESSAPRRPSQRPRKRSFHEEREMAQLEERIPTLEERRESLAQDLQQAADDYEQAAALGRELAAIDEELDAAETRWLELGDIGEE